VTGSPGTRFQISVVSCVIRVNAVCRINEMEAEMFANRPATILYSCHLKSIISIAKCLAITWLTSRLYVSEAKPIACSEL
jgi:hypothetical protein